jgi:hypothetical protein
MIERAKALPKSALLMPFSRGKILDELPAGSSSLKPPSNHSRGGPIKAVLREQDHGQHDEPGYV